MASRNKWMNRDGEDEVSSRTGLPHPGGRLFEIQVKGQLSENWSDWLEGLEVKLLENGEMLLLGPIVDQAALMGVLNKLSSLNLKLLSVNEAKRENQKESK